MSSTNKFIAGLFGTILIFAFTESCVLAQNFDEPIRKQIVDYGITNPSESSSPHIKLSCFYYARFMVKQYDMGELGSEWLAISPISEGTLPKCSRIHGAQEKVIENWTGYFKGVKGNYAFFNAEDCFNGGCPFAVIDATTGKKIFEDSSRLMPDGRHDKFQLFRTSSGIVTIRYTRVYAGECSIPKEKSICWERFRTKNALLQSASPICSGYDDASKNTYTLNNPSVIGYPVEVRLSENPSIKVLPDSVKCWGAD